MTHVVGLSGGKDSTALLIYMMSKGIDVVPVFTDTGAELPETYTYLDKIERVTGVQIVRLMPRSFDDWLAQFGGFLPSARARWCTRELKIRPMEAWLQAHLPATVYIGIRADEPERVGNTGTPGVIYRYPFREDGIVKADVLRMLDESGLGLPSYYEWRSRSGCYFCPFQRIGEWRELYYRYPELYWQAAKYEKDGFTWRQGASLHELAERFRHRQTSLFDDIDEEACWICRA